LFSVGEPSLAFIGALGEAADRWYFPVVSRDLAIGPFSC
jgi:hypothetical protein